jgi:hypothetical protein
MCEKTTQRGAQWCVLLAKYYLGDHIEKNEMGGPCSTYGGEKRCIQASVGKAEGKNHLKDPGVEGRIILRWIFRKWNGGYVLDCSGLG